MTASFMHSREGAIQGDPLTMSKYGICILPLMKNCKREIPDATQPWYADNSGALGRLARIETYFNSITRQGLGNRCYSEPSKSVLIVHPENLEARKEFGSRHGFKVVMSARYLRGYIGDDRSKSNLLRERTLAWENNIRTTSETAGEFPQESYAAVVCEIQRERIFM